MRTTVTLPDETYRQVVELAERTSRSVSSVLADMTARGLASLGTPVEFQVHPVTGFPQLALSRTYSVDEVAELLDEDS